MKKKFILIFGLICILIIILFFIKNLIFSNEIIVSTENILLKNNTLNLSSLTTQQKIGQMIIVRGDWEEYDYAQLNVGGIFLDRQKSEKAYSEIIKNFQSKSKIKLFVATDLEGAWTPFHDSDPLHDFPFFSEINTPEEAFDVGKAHGELLKRIGFNLNFAPVSEFTDEAYGGRVFLGSEEEIKNKISSYIQGLQLNVFGTCKHYPGNSLIKNLHETTDYQNISKKDLELFEICEENNISSIMVSHQIVTGELDSKGKPSTVSKEVISSLNGYGGLIIADEINMNGLRDFYETKIDLYVDLINSGEELILDFELNPKELEKLLEELEEKVEKGEINREKVDNAVRKILIKKGYEIL